MDRILEELGRGNHEQNMLRENFFFSVENKRSNNTKKKALQKCLQFDLMAIFSPLRFPFPRL